MGGGAGPIGEHEERHRGDGTLGGGEAQGVEGTGEGVGAGQQDLVFGDEVKEDAVGVAKDGASLGVSLVMDPDLCGTGVVGEESADPQIERRRSVLGKVVAEEGEVASRSKAHEPERALSEKPVVMEDFFRLTPQTKVRHVESGLPGRSPVDLFDLSANPAARAKPQTPGRSRALATFVWEITQNFFPLGAR